MHPTISQRRAILDGLRQRNALAAAEFYNKAGITEPVRAVRFKVVPRGNNEFEVIERATDKMKGLRIGHGSACQFAQKLEEDADQPVQPAGRQRSLMGNLAVNMMGWTLVLCVVLIALAVSAHR